MNRRAFLLAGGAVGVAAIMPRALLAQSTGSTTVLGLTKNGYVMINETVNGVTLSKGQQRVLGRIGTQIAQKATTRAAANATFSAVARTAITGVARFGLLGLAAGLAIGGLYCYYTGTGYLDLLLDLTGAGSSGVKLNKPCTNADSRLQTNQGSYPDTVTMGWYKATTSTWGYRICVDSTNSANSATSPGSGWSWGHTQNLGNGTYRHFYTTTGSYAGSGCSTEYLNLPGNTNLEKSLSSVDKAKVLADSALDAFGLSLWDAVGKSWTGGGFTGGGGGSFGGGGASGTWVDPAPSIADAKTAPRTPDAIIKPLPQKGTLDDLPPMTVGDSSTPWTAQPDPGLFEFPKEIPFPDDATTPGGGGSTPTPTPSSTPTPSTTPTPTPGTGSGGSGDCASSTSWWEFWKPSCEPAMKEPNPAGEAPKLDALVNPLKSVFDPISTKLTAGGGSSCPAWELPAFHKSTVLGTFDTPAMKFTTHCDLIEPWRNQIVTGLGLVGLWRGFRNVLDA